MPLKSLLRILVLGIFAVSLPMAATAQVLEDRQYRIAFQAGKSAITIREEIVGGERAIYRLSARSGQTMEVKLSSTTRLVEFSIYDPKAWPDGRPLATSTLVGALVPELNRYVGKLPATGDYRIVIRHIRDLSLPRQRSNFRLDVSVTGGTAQDGGTATQLPGNPAVASAPYFKVVGLAAGDKLNMRAGPGTSFRVVDRLASGEVVRNEGCATSAGQQWCEVSRPSRPRESGWVSSRYLAASKAPQDGGVATQLPGDALVGGTGYNATGSLTCRIANRARTCAFGVIRRAGGM